MSNACFFSSASRALRLVSVLVASVVALTACGGGDGYGGDSGGNACGGAYNEPCPPTNPPVGMGAPSVTLSAIGATVNRTVALSATPTAPNGVTRVEFLVDGTVVGMATASPYTVNWDTSTVSDGAHTVVARVTDAMNLTASSAAANVTVANVITLDVTLSPGEEFPVPAVSSTGTAQVTINLVSGAVSGSVTVTGFTSTAAHIHNAYAGNAGAVVIGFVANGSTANRWDAPANALLTADQVDRLLAGALYLNVHSAAFPAGEVRGQLKPQGVQVVHAPMSGAQEVPPVTTSASGIAAVTINTLTNRATIHLNSTGVDDAVMAHIHTGAAGANGPVLIALTKDSVNMGHWSAEEQSIAAADLTAFNGGNWYANIHTPANTGGEIRGQIVAPSSAPAATLAQLQSTVFTPSCAGCHTGGGATLPASMNLTSASASFAALVNVASVQQPSLMRVAPNNVAGSYLIHKLEGAATITGSRMPQGGPFLSQATIDTVKSWINSGAPNN